jgi:hypothetical protein
MAEAHTPQTAHPGDKPDVHHETTDVNVKGILLFGAGLFVTAVIVHLLVWVLFGFFSGRADVRAVREYPLTAGRENQLPPEPRLQTNPRDDLIDLHAHEEELLTTYGWVDKEKGIVRIPIEEAMRIVVERGLPARKAPDERR